MFILVLFTLAHVFHAAQFITDVADHADHECNDGKSVIAWKDRYPGGCKTYIHSSKCVSVERDPTSEECENMGKSQGAVNHRYSKGRCTLFFQYPVNGWDECGQSLSQKDVDGYKYSYPDTCEIYYHYRVRECTDPLIEEVNPVDETDEFMQDIFDGSFGKMRKNITESVHDDGVIEMTFPMGELLCGSCSRILS